MVALVEKRFQSSADLKLLPFQGAGSPNRLSWGLGTERNVRLIGELTIALSHF